MNKAYSYFFNFLFIIVLVAGCGQQSKPEVAVADENYDPESKLRELKITLPEPPQPVANYVNGVRAGNLIFFSRQRPKKFRRY